MDHTPFHDTITRALELGGQVLLNYFGKVRQVRVKENLSSVVSEADIESERVILEQIRNDFPNHNIISEEYGFVSTDSIFTWIIDPLDGTSNFIAGLPWFGILVAVLKDHLPVAAGAYIPADKDLYYAEKGKSSSLNGTSIQVSRAKSLKDVLVSYSLDFNPDYNVTQAEGEIISRLVRNSRNLRSTNSLLDLCYTADGRLGAALNQHQKIWDIAAPWLIIKEAGGMVTGMDGKAVDFRVDDTDFDRDFATVTASPGLHGEIMGLLSIPA
jgi:myo-inositol-1(or 4)-monophosphatase